MTIARTPSPARLIAVALLHKHRSVLLLVGTVLLIGAVAAVAADHDLGLERQVEDLWWAAAGIAVKFGSMVIGSTLVTVHLRPFVANGITRHAFVAGAAGFGLLVAAGSTALVAAGVVLQTVTRGILGLDSAGRMSGDDLAVWCGHALPLVLAYLVSGLLFGAARHQGGLWAALGLAVLALAPILFAEALLPTDDATNSEGSPLGYAFASAICLVVTGLGFVVARRVIGAVAIPRTVG